jgi:hypothetical protein
MEWVVTMGGNEGGVQSKAMTEGLRAGVGGGLLRA